MEKIFDREFLIEHYVNQKKSMTQIAKENNNHYRCVKQHLIKNNIPIRKQEIPKLLSKELLISEYVINKKSSHQIAEEYNTTKTSVIKKLKDYNIPIRPATRLNRPNKNPSRSMVQNLNPSVKYGKLRFVRFLDNKKCECICDCGKTIVVMSSNFSKYRIKSCGCLKGKVHDGYGEITGNLFGRYKRGAKIRNISFEISAKDMWEIYIKQNKKCAISGVEIPITKPERTAPLDRIDSKKGYTTNNIQWIHKSINTMKWNLSQKDFIQWCKVIAKNNPD